MRSRIPVAPEGWPFIAVPAAIAAGLLLAGRRRLALPFVGASLASLGFFRDPERESPPVADAVLSPLDVHVNRSPIAGVVAGTRYRPGKFVPAYKPDAGDVNECMTVNIQGERARVTVMQVAGVVARRIVCRVAEGDKLAAGERFGMIRFGSRTDCYMPHGSVVRVQPGQRVIGGVTMIGELP